MVSFGKNVGFYSRWYSKLASKRLTKICQFLPWFNFVRGTYVLVTSISKKIEVYSKYVGKYVPKYIKTCIWITKGVNPLLRKRGYCKEMHLAVKSQSGRWQIYTPVHLRFYTICDLLSRLVCFKRTWQTLKMLPLL